MYTITCLYGLHGRTQQTVDTLCAARRIADEIFASASISMLDIHVVTRGCTVYRRSR